MSSLSDLLESICFLEERFPENTCDAGIGNDQKVNIALISVNLADSLNDLG